jgi:hypothetical protein
MGIETEFGGLPEDKPLTKGDIDFVRLSFRDIYKRQEEMRLAQQESKSKLKNLDDGQVYIIEKLKAQDSLIRENTEITESVRDIFTAGRFGTNILQWLGRVWPGIAVIVFGLREYLKSRS